MDEITAFEEEATTIMAEVSARMAKAKKPVEVDIITVMENRATRAAQAIKAMKLEIREQPKNIQPQLNTRANKLEERLKQLNSQINSLADNSGDDTNTLIKKAVKIQEADITTLSSICNTIQKMKQMSTTTPSHNHSQQIRKESNILGHVSSSLK